MENPYQAPKADLDNGIVEPKSKRGWKIFFWLLLILEVVSIVFMWEETTSSVSEFLISFVVYPLILIGLYGYAYNKQFQPRPFWKILIFIGIFTDLYSFWDVMNETEGFTDEVELYVTLGLTIALILPMLFFQYLGIYRYGYHAPEIWKEDT